MKFHLPSYLLGAASAVAVMSFPKRFRPVFVEAAAVGQILVRTGRALVARQREAFEDLWAEISERAAERMRQSATNGQPRTGAAASAATNDHAHGQN